MNTNSWWYYSFTPAIFGLPYPGLWFDFPHLEVGANYLYFTTNIFYSAGNSYYGAMIVRLSLADLAANAATTPAATIYLSGRGVGSITTVSGITTTAYFGARGGSNSVAVIQWPESAPAPSPLVFVSTAGTTFFGTFTCLGPDGRDPCTRADTRMQTGWLTSTEIGFMWGSAQNAASGRLYPFTRIVTFNPMSLAVQSDSDMWSSMTAFLYPAVAVNARGHQGGVIDVLGGTLDPNVAAMIRDDFSAGGWISFGIAASNYGTNGRGDYNGAAMHTKYPNTWLIGSHVQLVSPTGSNATGRNSWIMRQRDVPGPALAVTSLGADTTFPVVAGTPVTWTALATGGTAPYTYKFWVFDGSTWTVGRDWNASNTWTWYPPRGGNYTIQVWVRNAGSSNAFDGWLNAAATISSPSVLTITSVLPSAATVTAGTPVTWTATADGGASPYMYKFYVYDGAGWTVGQDWSVADAWTWTPPAAGTFSFQVWARNAGSMTAFDAWRAFGPMTVGVPAAVTVTSLSANRVFPVPAGTPVTWTAAALGGTAPYTYKFYVFNGSSWTIGQDWSASNTWTWVPPASGSYTVQVWVRNAGSGTTFDAWRGVGPFTIGSPTALSVTSLTADQMFPVPAGTPVRWTATAIGGTGPYTFKFYVWNGSFSVIGQEWGAADTFTWVPPAAGTYTLQVWARNAGSMTLFDAWTSAGPLTVVGPAALAVTKFTLSPMSPLVVNGPATFTAMATGGTGPYTYQSSGCTRGRRGRWEGTGARPIRLRGCRRRRDRTRFRCGCGMRDQRHCSMRGRRWVK